MFSVSNSTTFGKLDLLSSLDERVGAPTLLGPLEKLTSINGPVTEVSSFLPEYVPPTLSPEDGNRSSSQDLVSFRIPEDGQSKKRKLGNSGCYTPSSELELCTVKGWPAARVNQRLIL
jgi:hypothetical protein